MLALKLWLLALSPISLGLPMIERQGGPNNVEFEVQESNTSPLLSGNINLQKSDLYQSATVWTIRNYWSVKANYELIRSEEFYESTYGYRISLVLFLKSFQDRNYLGIFMLLQPGEYDNNLSWPFSKRVTFSVLDQTGNNNHWSLTFDAKEIYDKCPDCFNRHFEKNNKGWGFPTLISHADLESTYNPYLRNDTIQLRIITQ
ncbi:TNF receptor-associated factor 5-like [Tachypleus tridentatus]|uniref:TNF receptor-associated factor 5-like n=1 Tax=Tachypleus tridentatus TaxID=6853 RepID=UPI003FD1532C